MMSMISLTGLAAGAMDPAWTTIVGILMGFGLASACGFRLFVPMLITSMVARSGVVTLSSGFDWMASDVALFAFAAATVVEIAGYYVPWVDNLLDTIATPAAAIAGTLVAAPFITGMDPSLEWLIAAIVGGGSATGIQLFTVGTRAVSTLTTGGLGNPVVSTAEAGASTVLAGMALFVPILAALIVIGLFVMFFKLVRRRKLTRMQDGPSHASLKPAAESDDGVITVSSDAFDA